MKYILLLTILFSTSCFAWFSDPIQVSKIEAHSGGEFTICFKEPYKDEKLMYDITLLRKDDRKVTRSPNATPYSLLTASTKDQVCYKNNLSGFLNVGRMDPVNIEQFSELTTYETFSSITFNVYSSQGTGWRTKPDELLHSQTIEFHK